MRKTLIMAALVLISAGCFAQKNPATKKAKSYMNSENPDFNAARASIAEALEQEPTAETYYLAGMIGYKQVEQQNNNPYISLAKDVQIVGEAMEESMEYFVKADELAQVLVKNKKNVDVPTDPKMRGKVSKMLLSYYKSNDLLRYGAELAEAKDFEGAYKAFHAHLSIPKLDLMQDPKLQKEMELDTTYYNYMFNSAYYALRAEKHQEAIEVLLQLKAYGQIEPLLVNQFLCQEYVTVNDSANYIKALQEGIMLFPQEDFFIQSYVAFSVQTKKEADAVEFFSKLIENNPNEPLYYVKRGVLYEMLERYDDAMIDFDKVLESDPNNVDAIAGKGRVYYNKAVKMNEAAASIMDNKEYKKAVDEMNEVFRQSLPYFEKAHQLDPTRSSFIQALKEIYFRFRSEPGMQAKYDEMVEKLNNL
ncbi:MAG: tetratricopeptide repeat protein [Paludibacteraceae bacterium]|nr:tetratricopeptide repeat protein [Paludibacteraceae bacterium]